MLWRVKPLMETRRDVLICYLLSNHRNPQATLTLDPTIPACSWSFKIKAITRLSLGFQWLTQETKHKRTKERTKNWGFRLEFSLPLVFTKGSAMESTFLCQQRGGRGLSWLDLISYLFTVGICIMITLQRVV